MMLATVLLALPLMGQIAPPAAPRPRVSPHETINAIVAGTYQANPVRMTIIYGRPYSKEPRGEALRKIWGTLVPWGQVWRLGSDEATIMITEKPLLFGTTEVPAGVYTLYMQPEQTGTSKLIINKKVGQWGIPYPDDLKAQELARVDLKKETLNTQVDQFTMAIVPKQGGGGGTIKLWWETTQYSVDFTVKP